MKTKSVLAALLASLLSACASYFGNADPAKPEIRFDPTKSQPTLQVDQPVLNFLPGQGRVAIVWRLQKDIVEGRGRYRFDRKIGIFIDGEITNQVLRNAPGRPDSLVLDRERGQRAIHDCTTADDGLTFTCINEHREAGLYKYTITLTGEGPPIVLDPVIANW